MLVINILRTLSPGRPKICDIYGVLWRSCYAFWSISLPPKSHRPLSLSPLSLNDALFIEPCLRRPKFDKETLKGSQPHLLQT